MYTLLNKGQKWKWESKKQPSKKQNALLADSVLVHYDPSKPMILACDDSDYGIGVVLSHLVDENQERPIVYISRSLTAAEKLEKEALAIAFAVKNFYH